MIERHKKWVCEYHGGGVYVYNRENLILEQYPFEVKQASKGRGVLIKGIQRFGGQGRFSLPAAAIFGRAWTRARGLHCADKGR